MNGMSGGRGYGKDIGMQVEVLRDRLRRRQLVGSSHTALETAFLVRHLISQARFTTFENLASQVREVGRKLTAANPREFAVGNTIRRILRLLREEYREAKEQSRDGLERPSYGLSPYSIPSTPGTQTPVYQPGTHSSDPFSIHQSKKSLPEQLRFAGGGLAAGGSGSSGKGANTSVVGGGNMYRLLVQSGTSFEDSKMKIYLGKRQEVVDPNEEEMVFDEHGELCPISSLKPLFIQAIQEAIDELETVYNNVASQAGEHIHTNEIIMVGCGPSKTLEYFLRFAARKRKFTVIVPQSGPRNTGHDLAKALASYGIDTVLIPDSNIFAIMSRVNKVILGTHAILANGSLLAHSGTKLVAQAAKAHRIPVLVCAGLHKLSPIHPSDEDSLLEFAEPGRVISFQAMGEMMNDQWGDEKDDSGGIEVLNPQYDYIESKLVDLFLTNLGGHPPSFLYRLIQDNYDIKDVDL